MGAGVVEFDFKLVDALFGRFDLFILDGAGGVVNFHGRTHLLLNRTAHAQHSRADVLEVGVELGGNVSFCPCQPNLPVM